MLTPHFGSTRMNMKKKLQFFSYYGAVNYWLEKYASEDFIAVTYANIIHFTLLVAKLPMQHAESLWNNTVRCTRVYDEFVVKDMFIEG